MDLDFKGKYLISARLVAVTGLHIGGAQEGIEIGGVDNPVIKDPVTEQPYVPGSSLKGKLRHLLEWSLGRIEPHSKHSKPDKPVFTAHFCGKCESCRLFGVSADDDETRREAGPTRLTVRDAFLTDKEDNQNPKRFYSRKELARLLGEDIYTEVKTENALDRVTSEANPRPLERVPAGAAFEVEMIFDVYRGEDRDLLKSLFAAMHLLENSALGGSGSRGSGRVRFEDIRVEWRPVKDFYLNGGQALPVEVPTTVTEVVKSFDTIDWKLTADGAPQASKTGGG